MLSRSESSVRACFHRVGRCCVVALAKDREPRLLRCRKIAVSCLAAASAASLTCDAVAAPPMKLPLGAVLHVSTTGSDAGDGSLDHELRTISAAAERARPGDTITVHAGTYRERVDPPRGGVRSERPRSLVASDLLGRTQIGDLPFEQSDGRAFRFDRDYFGRPRDPADPFPGPIETPAADRLIKVWPKNLK